MVQTAKSSFQIFDPSALGPYPSEIKGSEAQQRNTVNHKMSYYFYGVESIWGIEFQLCWGQS